MPIFKSFLISLCLLVVLCTNALAYKSDPFFSEVMSYTCKERNLGTLQSLLQQDYDPFFGKTSALITASQTGFSEGVLEILAYSPKSFYECTPDQRSQFIASIALLAQLKTKTKIPTISKLLEYFESIQKLTPKEIEALTVVMDEAGRKTDLDTLKLFLNFGLRPKKLNAYNIPLLAEHEIEDLFPTDLKGSLPQVREKRELREHSTFMWQWIVNEVEKRRVSRWHFPGALITLDFQSNDPTPAFLVGEAISLAGQPWASLRGICKLPYAKQARFQAQLIGFSLVKKGFLPNPIKLPRSVGSIGNFTGIKTYSRKDLEEKFNLFVQILESKYQFEISRELLNDALLQVGKEMFEKNQYYDSEAFLKAVAQYMNLR